MRSLPLHRRSLSLHRRPLTLYRSLSLHGRSLSLHRRSLPLYRSLTLHRRSLLTVWSSVWRWIVVHYYSLMYSRISAKYLKFLCNIFYHKPAIFSIRKIKYLKMFFIILRSIFQCSIPKREGSAYYGSGSNAAKTFKEKINAKLY